MSTRKKSLPWKRRSRACLVPLGSLEEEEWDVNAPSCCNSEGFLQGAILSWSLGRA